LHNLTLRELLVYQSLYVCKTMTDIFDVVNDQPCPDIFFKSSMELDFANMVSILSFDAKSMGYLLDESMEPTWHEDFKDKNFPLFYKNKI
jgi:hypothetical protein